MYTFRKMLSFFSSCEFTSQIDDEENPTIPLTNNVSLIPAKNFSSERNTEKLLPVDKLPFDVLTLIYAYLTPREIFQITLTSKIFLLAAEEYCLSDEVLNSISFKEFLQPLVNKYQNHV